MGFFNRMFMRVGIFIVIILVLIAGGGFFVYQALFTSSIVPAQLNVESGEVKVDDVLVNGNIKLKSGTVIETLTNGLATVILHESTLVSLSENTKVKIDELILKHPKITQEKGKTWSKFTKLFGSEDYSVKAGNTVASVRGTAFLLTENKIVTGEGEVDYQIDDKPFVVRKYKAVEKKDGEIIERDATKEELAEIRSNFERSIKQLKNLRNMEINKKGFLVSQIKKRFSITDEQIQEVFDMADNRKIDIDEMINEYKDRIPVDINLQSIDKVIAITKEIQRLNIELDEIKS